MTDCSSCCCGYYAGLFPVFQILTQLLQVYLAAVRDGGLRPVQLLRNLTIRIALGKEGDDITVCRVQVIQGLVQDFDLHLQLDHIRHG